MKQLVTLNHRAGLLLVLCMYAGAFNSPAQRGFQLPEPHHYPTFQQAGAVQNKGTGTGSRLLFYSYYTANSSGAYIFSDSARYAYPNATTNICSESVAYVKYTGQLDTSYRHLYTYDANGHLICDLVLGWNYTGYDTLTRIVYTLNAAGYTTHDLYQGRNFTNTGWLNSLQNFYTLDINNRIIDKTYQSWNATTNTWDPYYYYTYTLNAAGSVLSNIVKQGSAAIGTNLNRFDYLYDTTGANMIQMTTLDWNGTPGAWTNHRQDVYTLNAAGKPSQYISYVWNNTAFAPHYRVFYTYDSNGNQTVEEVELYNNSTSNYYKSGETIQTFNSYNQALTYATMFWNNVTNSYMVTTGYFKRNYYYEPYTTTSIHNTSNSGAHLTIYPNPATDLHLSIKWEAAQSLTVTLTDMAGRVYTTISAPSAKEYSTTLSVADLPAGNYLLSIKGSNGSTASQLITVKH